MNNSSPLPSDSIGVGTTSEALKLAVRLGMEVAAEVNKKLDTEPKDSKLVVGST